MDASGECLPREAQIHHSGRHTIAGHTLPRGAHGGGIVPSRSQPVVDLCEIPLECEERRHIGREVGGRGAKNGQVMATYQEAGGPNDGHKG